MTILPYAALPADQQAALVSYAKERGKRWKSALELDWYNARVSTCHDMPNRGNILHALRNHPAFGFDGLRAVKLPKA